MQIKLDKCLYFKQTLQPGNAYFVKFDSFIQWIKEREREREREREK